MRAGGRERATSWFSSKERDTQRNSPRSFILWKLPWEASHGFCCIFSPTQQTTKAPKNTGHLKVCFLFLQAKDMDISQLERNREFTGRMLGFPEGFKEELSVQVWGPVFEATITDRTRLPAPGSPSRLQDPGLRCLCSTKLPGSSFLRHSFPWYDFIPGA